MDTTNAPQIFEHITESLDFTPFAAGWLGHTPRLAVMGQTPKMEGVLRILKMEKNKFKELSKMSFGKGFKSFCSNTFKNVMTNQPSLKSENGGEGQLSQNGYKDSFGVQIAVADVSGKVCLIDLVKEKIFYEVEAHKGMANAVDTMGGVYGSGVLEFLTGGSDGCVRLWDPRQAVPVLALEPESGEGMSLNF